MEARKYVILHQMTLRSVICRWNDRQYDSRESAELEREALNGKKVGYFFVVSTSDPMGQGRQLASDVPDIR